MTSTGATGTGRGTRADHGADEKDEVLHEIAETREQLGETVEALAQKADVRARVMDKVDETRVEARDRLESAQESAQDVVAKVRDDPRPYLVAAGVALVVLVALRRVGRHR